MRKPNIQKLQATCDAWNQSHPIGSPVFVQLDNRVGLFATTTRSDAQVLSGHSAVIWIDGVACCYLLDRVTPRKE